MCFGYSNPCFISFSKKKKSLLDNRSTHIRDVEIIFSQIQICLPGCTVWHFEGENSAATYGQTSPSLTCRCGVVAMATHQRRSFLDLIGREHIFWSSWKLAKKNWQRVRCLRMRWPTARDRDVNIKKGGRGGWKRVNSSFWLISRACVFLFRVSVCPSTPNKRLSSGWSMATRARLKSH